MDERFLNRWCVAVTLSVIIILSVTARSDAKSQTITQQSIHKIELQQGWSYHWGDLEQDEQGQPIETSTAAVWEAYRTDILTLRDKHTYLWLKRTLGPDQVPNAAIFLPHFSSYLAFEVYVDHTLIYRTGEFSPSFSNRHHPILWHLIPLPANYAGKTIFFRFYSDHPRYIGFLSDIWVGERNELMDRFVINGIDATLLSLLFMIIGGFGYAFFIKIYHTKNTQLFSFATMSLCSGIYYLAAEGNITLLSFAHPVILSYLRFSMFFLFIGSFYLFFELTTGIGPKFLYRFMWQLHLVFFISVFPLGALKIEFLETLFNISMLSAGVGIMYSEIQLVKIAFQGDAEGRILSLAFGVFGLAGILDMLAGLYIVAQNWLFYPWGLLFLLVSLAYLFILRYQSEMKTLQAEAIRSAHLASLGEMAAGVAHEINNPINGIIGYAEILADESREQGRDHEIPEQIKQEALRIAKIVGNLLSFSRKQPGERNLVRIQQIIDDALALMNKLFRKSQITIQLQIPENLPLIMADRQQIQQVFINILSNARYALEQADKESDGEKEKIFVITGQTISVQECQYVRIIFYDNGIGIPAEMLDKICLPFVTTKPRGEGVGLGLSISYGIINDHGGQLLFESKHKTYTKVMVDLPAITT